MMRYEESGDFTTTLHRRLLYILNENLPGSTWYCIAMKMLQYYGDLDMISIEEMASLCAVSKSTISKFIRVLGYEDYRTFQKQAAINLNRKQRENYFVTDVTRYIDEHSTDAYVDAVLRDIRMTYELLDWEKWIGLQQKFTIMKRLQHLVVTFLKRLHWICRQSCAINANLS